ncbi:hypothetical protein HRTV-28_gp42 [Halorubrum tailed virus 28]|uniref:Uncharacterized protein n=1 Tax=Halorubrum tailed virus 28 TaxID=2878009 RepID=A0AAE8Y0A8_9CAUD|nr:hypothetical protein M1M39_gp43 [Halorubrum tailed virus 28]UBF23480.1 hypothetical protein HRTV-28_gp42 [Halorubrum tailed virus 28]
MTKVTRRTVAASFGALVVGTGALATTTEQASGETLTVEGLTVDDVEHDSPDGMVSDVIAEVTAEYALEATTDVATIEFTLRAGRDDPDSDTTEIATESATPDARDTTGNVDLSGPITYASAFQIADFRPSDAGEEVVIPVRVQLVADAIDAAGATLAEDMAEDTAEVTVRQKEDVLTFEVGGSGTIEIEE